MSSVETSSCATLWRLGLAARVRKGRLLMIGIGVGLGVVVGVSALLRFRERTLPEPVPEPPSLRAAGNGAMRRYGAD